MSSLRLKDSVEVAGIAAIVASLIFVGLELRQSQEIAIAAQYHARIELNLGYFDSNDDDDGLRLFGEASRQSLENLNLEPEQANRLSKMTDIEFGREIVNMRRILFIFDNSHFQYQSGFMDEESWQSIRRRTRQVLGGNPMARIELHERSHRWRDSMILELENMIREFEEERR